MVKVLESRTSVKNCYFCCVKSTLWRLTLCTEWIKWGPCQAFFDVIILSAAIHVCQKMYSKSCKPLGRYNCIGIATFIELSLPLWMNERPLGLKSRSFFGRGNQSQPWRFYWSSLKNGLWMTIIQFKIFINGHVRMVQ